MKKLLTIALAVLMISALAVTSFGASFWLDEPAWGWGTEWDEETKTASFSGAWKGIAFEIAEEYREGATTVTIDFDEFPMIDLQMGIQNIDGTEIVGKWFPAGTDNTWTFQIPEGETVRAIEIKAGGEYKLVIKDIYTNGVTGMPEVENDAPAADTPAEDTPAEDTTADAPEADTPAEDTTADAPAADTTETPADTGLVFALVPMAVALAAIAFSKKR